APLDIAHASVGPLAHLRNVADSANGVEHACNVMRVEGEHRGATRHPRGRRLGIPRGHGAHLAHALGQQQVGPRGGESRAVDFVHTAELAQGLPHGRVDLAAGKAIQAESWTCEDRLGAGGGRGVAAMRDAHQAIAQPELVRDLGGAGEERRDPGDAHGAPKRSSPPRNTLRRRAGKFVTSWYERSNRFSTLPTTARPGAVRCGRTRSTRAARSTRVYAGSVSRWNVRYSTSGRRPVYSSVNDILPRAPSRDDRPTVAECHGRRSNGCPGTNNAVDPVSAPPLVTRVW